MVGVKRVSVHCVGVALDRVGAYLFVLFATSLPFRVIAVARLENGITIRSRFAYFFFFVGQAAQLPFEAILEFRFVQHCVLAVLDSAPCRHRVVTATHHSCWALAIIS